MAHIERIGLRVLARGLERQELRGVERLGRPPVYVEHLLVGMVGGFQPDKLARAFEGDNDGMHARLLFAWPEELPHRLLTDESEEVEPEIFNALARLVDLPDLEEGVFAARTIALSLEACAAFEDFRARHHSDKAALDGREREWFAKGPSQVLRLSATLALMDWAWRGGPPPSAVEAASLSSRSSFGEVFGRTPSPPSARSR